MKQNDYGLSDQDILNMQSLIDYRIEAMKRLRESVSDKAIAEKYEVPVKFVEALAKNKTRGRLA